MGKSKPAPLSASQREIMEIVWERGEISTFELREILSERRQVARETVRTLLSRMEEKGWLRHRVVGRTFFYSAAIRRDTSHGQRVLELVEEVCGGSVEQLVSTLLTHRGLSDEEAKRIQAMLDGIRGGKRTK